MLREADPRKGFITVEQYDLLHNALPQELRPVLTLGFYCALRSGEVRKPEWASVDLKVGVIRLAAGETKSGKGRVIPLNADLLAMLGELNNGATSKFVFGNGRPLGNFRKAWYRACVSRVLGNLEEMPDGKVYTGTLFHDLRRSAIMLMTQCGGDLTEAKKISGHESDSVFQRCNTITGARVLAAGKKMDSFIEQPRRKLGSGRVITAEVVRPALPNGNGDEVKS